MSKIQSSFLEWVYDQAGQRNAVVVPAWEFLTRSGISLKNGVELARERSRRGLVHDYVEMGYVTVALTIRGIEHVERLRRCASSLDG